MGYSRTHINVINFSELTNRATSSFVSHTLKDGVLKLEFVNNETLILGIDDSLRRLWDEYVCQKTPARLKSDWQVINNSYLHLMQNGTESKPIYFDVPTHCPYITMSVLSSFHIANRIENMIKIIIPEFSFN